MLKSLFDNQRIYLNSFFDHLDIEKTEQVLSLIEQCRGNLFFSGIGKSGIIATKLAVTFSSLGTKAFFLSAVDAMHGDLGRITNQDLFILLSKSGYTQELIDLIPHIKSKGAKIISIVCNENTPLVKSVDLSIYLPLVKELCPYNLAPTTSTTMQLIFGDVLAIALMQKKKVQREDFAKNHPKGAIGKKLTVLVSQIMRKEQAVPKCYADQTLLKVLPILSEKRCGSVLVVDKEENLLGIFTDGDLRRVIEKESNEAFSKTIGSIMSKNPITINPSKLALDALQLMEKDPNRLIMVLPVVKEKKVVGILHLHDVLQAGLKN